MDYIYALGKIRVLEKRLLNKIDIDRMVYTETAEKAFQVLNNTDFSDNLLQVEAHQYERAIQADLLQSKDLIQRMSVDDERLFYFLFLKYDFHNIKTLLKLRLKKEENWQDKLIPFGTHEAEELVNYILLDNRKDLPAGDFKDSINRLLNHLSSETIDNLCDQEYFKLILSWSRKLRDEFLLSLVVLEIDFANLRMILRARQKIENFYIFGGNISFEQFLQIKNQGDEAVMNYLRFYLTKTKLKFFDRFFHERKLWQFEQAFDNLFISELKSTRIILTEPAMVAAYILAKDIAFRNVRIIMSGKINEAPVEMIKARIRDVF